jgi:biotin carboxylase/acetyl-CoA carboxylase carboxyltransferase component
MFERILICNNGMAAAKFLTSMNSAISAGYFDHVPLFFGMVTSDDLQANSTYIQYLDYISLVPSGPSASNFGNVDLIVGLAKEQNCDAVWPGWGHASENHLLAEGLEKAGIAFIGPTSKSMVLLGDKVESLLQAKRVGMPCAPWSGDSASTAAECGLYSPEQVVSVCTRIGFPVMLKASSGGGGKGIRRVDRVEDCVSAYEQIKSEVRDGYIFAMKCIENCRHVEIQILGDGKGVCWTLAGRDCSVQRRHQKLIEEGFLPHIHPTIVDSMLFHARDLCVSVNYRCAGTVEYLYDPVSDEFYFLEVNCRLQVEHPVTELLMDLNLPYLQLAVVEGSKPMKSLPGLCDLPKSYTGDDIPHVVACRIVAEDPTNKWLPSSGEIFEIRTPTVENVFAYFSISSSGSRIHQYADSQFGHVFSRGTSRKDAIMKLNKYLTQLSIVGSVSTNIQFMTSTILHADSEFTVQGPPTTNWLDNHFANKSSKSISRILSFPSLVGNDSSPLESVSLALLSVCAHLATQSFFRAQHEILRWVRRGHRAPHAPASFSETLVCPGGEKIFFESHRISPGKVEISVCGSSCVVGWEASSVGSALTRAIMTVNGIPGSLLVSVVEISGSKIRAQVGKNASWHQFEIEEDRTKVSAPMNGRLVRWLVPNMHAVSAGQRVCEIEAMKMVTVISAKTSGFISHKIVEGVSFIEGDVLASLETAEVERGLSAESPSNAGKAVLSGLLDLLQQSDIIRSQSSKVEQALEGFGPAVLQLELQPVTASVEKQLLKFSSDERRCAKYISTGIVGDEVTSLEVIAKASDGDLLTAWRHRTWLQSRMKTVETIVNSTTELLPVRVLEALFNSLDDRLHRNLILLLASQLKQQKHDHPFLAKISLEEEEPTTESGTSQPVIPDDPIARRRALAVEAGSFFIYDLPDMLLDMVRKLWSESDVETPEKIVESMQLLLSESGDELEPQEAGTMDVCKCGMAAFDVNIKTPEYPSGRSIIIIGNDISYQIGTFSVDEDKTYLLASRIARNRGVPRIYFACNSGARLGLCQEVQKLFRVEWLDTDNVSAGFRYLYLLPDDYEKVREFVRVKETNHPVHGTIYMLTDVLGKPDEYIGVENLVWSGAIAGESSRAYDETFTLSYVTGRTVGIGAYIARLCQRIIQKIDSPILLTGFQALNKLIGADVYQSNDEIGGVGVMFRNGVSHQVVESDSEGIMAVLKWLQFVPKTRNSSLPVLHAKKRDPIDRVLDDPGDGGRGLIDDSYKPTMFDKGSFVEVQQAWARSVIAGRARLGGIPVGVIVVETRQTHYYQPADPADPHSQTFARAQAGQVWYPDSAYKTAQAIMDFNREQLPLIILANWRGFSGGQRDMFNEILKFGSYIVDALRRYNQPVFVYLPPRAELRGGAWVVVDSRINPEMIEMYADPSARGGVLEPSGTTEIKFRTGALYDLMIRTDPETHNDAGKEQVKAQSIERFSEIKPTLVQVANTFADMHDTPERMLHVGAIRGIVEWQQARQFFITRLAERLGIAI